ncbi:MAG: DUF2948 family protein [Geminicoccaceae bacterium]
MTERLRLRAVDIEDLSVIAACLQDALIPLSEMAYLADERRFMAAFTRFQRERMTDPNRPEGLTQSQSVLVLHDIEAVRFHGLDSRFGAVRFELLTLISEPAEDGLHITLLFAGDAAIQLRAKKIAASLEDFGDPWPATTLPTHDWSPGRPEQA